MERPSSDLPKEQLKESPGEPLLLGDILVVNVWLEDWGEWR